MSLFQKYYDSYVTKYQNLVLTVIFNLLYLKLKMLKSHFCLKLIVSSIISQENLGHLCYSGLKFS